MALTRAEPTRHGGGVGVVVSFGKDNFLSELAQGFPKVEWWEGKQDNEGVYPTAITWFARCLSAHALKRPIIPAALAFNLRHSMGRRYNSLILRMAT